MSPRRWDSDPDERCAEGYLQGIGCPDCERASARLVAGLVVIVVLLLTLAAVWQGQS